jgi:hypothetical protein
MAHLSDDRQLCQLLRRDDRDVFRSIAATWKRKDVDAVSDAERNEAKQGSILPNSISAEKLSGLILILKFRKNLHKKIKIIIYQSTKNSNLGF